MLNLGPVVSVSQCRPQAHAICFVTFGQWTLGLHFSLSTGNMQTNWAHGTAERTTACAISTHKHTPKHSAASASDDLASGRYKLFLMCLCSPRFFTDPQTCFLRAPLKRHPTRGSRNHIPKHILRYIGRSSNRSPSFLGI